MKVGESNARGVCTAAIACTVRAVHGAVRKVCSHLSESHAVDGGAACQIAEEHIRRLGRYWFDCVSR